MAVGDAYVFPGFLTLVLTLLFFPKPPTTFLTCFCRGERRKDAGKKSHLNRGSNSQPPGHESDTLSTEPPERRLSVWILGLTFCAVERINLSFLTLCQTSPAFYVSAVQVFWKNCGKGEIVRYKQFLLFPQCFLPVWKTFSHFQQIWNCCLQTLSVWKV